MSPQELQTSAPQRKWAGLPLGEKITLQPLTLSKGLYAKAVQVEVRALAGAQWARRRQRAPRTRG